MASISQLLSALHGEVNRIALEQAEEDKTEELSEVLLDAINLTMREIKYGADSDDFADLTVANFMIEAAKRDYSDAAIARFVKALKAD